MIGKFILAGALASAASLAQAQEVRVGVNLPYTGIGAELAQQIDRGMEQYLKLNPVKGYKVTIVKRDVKDPGGGNARNVIQELLTQDKVDVLAGWVYSPNAIAAAPVVSAGKKLAVIMNAGTAHITQMSNYYVRTSFSMWHAGYAMGETAAKNLKAKTAVVGFTDFPPGKDMLASFRRAFEASGGKVIDEIPMGGAGRGAGLHAVLPARQGQEAGRVLRLRSGRRPFVGGGAHLRRARHAPGRHQADRPRRHHPGQQAAGDGPGRGRPHHHASLSRRPANTENQRFVASWKKDYGADSTPDFMAVGGYDGMAAIAHAIQATKGKMDAEESLAALRGWKFASPRGPILIDPDTRDIVMNEYLSEVIMKNGRLYQNTIATVENVKDACKALKIPPCK